MKCKSSIYVYYPKRLIEHFDEKKYINNTTKSRYDNKGKRLFSEGLEYKIDKLYYYLWVYQFYQYTKGME